MSTGELPPCEVLRRMIRENVVELPEHGQAKLVAGINPGHASALYQTVLKERPAVVVEIGMAQGVSTLSILTALAETGGRLISIDPYVNWKSGRAAALHAVQSAGFADRHEHMEELSSTALPRLIDLGIEVELGYIDGSHEYEDVFVDYFFLDRLLGAGGVLGFNDAGWRDVHQVIQNLRRSRRYAEVDVGLKRDYSGRNPLVTLGRRILGRPRQDRYFRKRIA